MNDLIIYHKQIKISEIKTMTDYKGIKNKISFAINGLKLENYAQKKFKRDD